MRYVLPSQDASFPCWGPGVSLAYSAYPLMTAGSFHGSDAGRKLSTSHPTAYIGGLEGLTPEWVLLLDSNGGVLSSIFHGRGSDRICTTLITHFHRAAEDVRPLFCSRLSS